MSFRKHISPVLLIAFSLLVCMRADDVLAQVQDQTGQLRITGSSTAPALELRDANNWVSGWGNNLKITANNFPSLRLHATNSNKTAMIGNHDDGALWFTVNGSGDTPGNLAMILTPTSRVGVGTTAPDGVLDLRSGAPIAYVSGTAANLNTGLTLRNEANASKGELLFAGSNIAGHKYFGLINRSADYLGIFSANTIRLQTSDPDKVRMFVDTIGQVGIGSTAPRGLLHVDGNGQNGNTHLVLQNVAPTDALYGGTSLQFINRAAGAAEYSWRINTTGNTAGFGYTANAFEVWEYAPGLPAVGRLKILKNTPGNDRPLILDGTGNLQVSGNLHATGDISATGVIKAKYQDLAELVPSKQTLTSGTVVTLDSNDLAHVRASARSYDTAVAGVISAQPGIVLGEAGEGKVKSQRLVA